MMENSLVAENWNELEFGKTLEVSLEFNDIQRIFMLQCLQLSPSLLLMPYYGSASTYCI